MNLARLLSTRTMTSRILVDGSVLEGGGQILRNAVAYSALLSKPIKIHKIRNGRTPPGLRNQHRTGLELAARISDAQLTGATTRSTEIEFVPGRIQLPKDHEADSITAGSTTLLLQVAYPLLLFSPTAVGPSRLTLLGGTNATMAPQIDYTKHVFLPFVMKHFNLSDPGLDIQKRGYFPKGGGQVSVNVVPLADNVKLPPVQLLERGRVKQISGIAHFAGLPNVVGSEMVVGATRRLAEAGYGPAVPPVDLNGGGENDHSVPVNVRYKREPNELTTGAGSGIVLWAELEGGGIIGGSCVGTKGTDPAKVGEEAATELLRGLDDGGCVDEWLQDEIIILMALADGRSEVRCGKSGLTLHTQTAIWLAQELTDAKFTVEEDADGTHIIRCDGIGYSGQMQADLTSRTQ